MTDKNAIRALLSLAVVAYCLRINGSNVIVDDTEYKIHKEGLITIKGPGDDSAGLRNTENQHHHSPMSKQMMLDNKLMRDMYLNATKRVFTIPDIQRMITKISSATELRLTDAVRGVVNLKLIQRLQFRILDSLFIGCWTYDKNAARIATSLKSDGVRKADDLEPICLSKLEDEPSARKSKLN